ncbi:MAG: WYL domain-containing protein, partial [Candidatus Marinimicrobia bacterium]|nr:WYL domain-containing protein [Candidatus Neomarinimicrobiota bacterium]MBT4946496.1 WYL domain-containing protein [Candidatus Neomarinimicrobiota bacterium]
LDHYINDREFDYPEGDFINLEFKAKDFVIQALRETPLSHNQGIRPFEDDWVIVSCRIKETQQLRWWLLGFGAQVEVLQPRHLRAWFKEQTKEMKALYQ